MNQSESVNYESVLDIVRQWPLSQRLTLVQEVLKTLAPEGGGASPPRQTLAKALGLLAQNQPAPTDENIQQWLDEHRTEKYR
jgi:hypothetical protein